MLLSLLVVISLIVTISIFVVRGRNDALFTAVKNGNLGTIKKLVFFGADVNAKDEYGYTVLYSAVNHDDSFKYKYVSQSDKLKIVKWLVEQGADVNAKREHGNTVLYRTVKSGNLELAKWLVNHGANVNEPGLLHLAAQSGNLELVKWLIDKGLDINAKTIDGETVINAAVDGPINKDRNRHYRLNVVLYLLEHGADVNEGFKDHLLEYAGIANHWELVKWLVVHGASVNNYISPNRSDSLLVHAAKTGNLEMVEWLVEHGANVNLPYGKALRHASRNWEIAQYLVNHGAEAEDQFFWLYIWLVEGCSNFSLLLSLILQSKISLFCLAILLFVVIYIIIDSIDSRKNQDLLSICNAIRSLQNNLHNQPDKVDNNEVEASAEQQKEQNLNENQDQVLDNSSEIPPSDVSN